MKIGEVEIFEEKCLDAVDWPKNQAPSEKWKLEISQFSRRNVSKNLTEKAGSHEKNLKLEKSEFSRKISKCSWSTEKASSHQKIDNSKNQNFRE